MTARILVADDEDSLRWVLEKGLRQAGYEVVAVKDGTSALGAFEAEPFDVVFLDVRMPGMSGIDVLRRIRQADGALPVVLLTGHAGEAEVAEARRLGVSEIIRKPRILANLEGILGELQK